MKNHEDRREFIKKTVTLAAALATVPFTPVVLGQQVRRVQHVPIPGTRIFNVSIRGSLTEKSTNILLAPNTVSDPINLIGKGVLRVMVVPGKVNPRFGQVFKVTLMDDSGTPLASMNLGNGATGTFTNYGVQVYILSIQQGT